MKNRTCDKMVMMNISRRKFTISFLVFGFVFLFITTTLLGTTGPRGFPQAPDSILRTGSDSPIAWKRTVSAAIVPIKAVLLGPVALPQVHFLKEDPPPPFIGIYFVFYWVLLASILRSLLGIVLRSSSRGSK